MRIGIDASKAVRPADGIGRYSLELLRALSALDDGPEIELFGLPPELDETAVRRQLGELPRSVALHRGWRVDAEAIDVFHSTAWNVPPGFAGPLVFTCHDLTFLSHPRCHILDNKVHCLDGLLRAHLADATFLAISRATAGELRRHLGLDGTRVEVIHPAPASGLRPRAVDEARAVLEQRFSIEGSPVLAVGTLEPRKNFERLLSAYAGLDEELRRAHPLVIAGGAGWKSSSLRRRIDELATAHHLGPVGDDDLGALYSAAAVFAYPSLAEGFGLPVVEAMACGAPVLTSNLSSLPEVAGDAARLVDPHDVEAIRRGLDELLRDEGEPERLRGLGRRRAASFSWAETARRTAALYRRVAAA